MKNVKFIFMCPLLFWPHLKILFWSFERLKDYVVGLVVMEEVNINSVKVGYVIDTRCLQG